MKQFRLVLIIASLGVGAVYAQDEERRAPPIEIPDFSNLDEYIYEPKSTVRLGMRMLSGAKTSFSGTGRILAPEDPGSPTGANLSRVYHNGAVQPDTRVVARLDSSGNPVIDPQTGSATFDPITPDGRTNTWNYTDLSQLNEIPGFVAFHTYSAEVTDTGTRERKGGRNSGMDLSVSRDMGKLFGRLPWNLTAGMSINDISANTNDSVRARLTTLTDYYSLFGQTPPEPPYSSPSTSSTNVTDAAGNPVMNEDGTTQTVTVDTSVLIGNQPAGRSTVVNENGSVQNRWRLKGAYYTFRAGPTLLIPITSRLRASLTAGAVIVYSGSNYTVTQTLTPDLGAEISNTESSDDYKLLPGYFADATVQFDLTERAGLYAGALFQSAGSYTQHVKSDTVDYSTKIDLGNQSGVHAGMSIRF